MTEPKEDIKDQNDACSSLNNGVSLEKDPVIAGDANDAIRSSSIEYKCPEIDQEREAECLEKRDEYQTSSVESAGANSDEIHVRDETERESSSKDTNTDCHVAIEKDVTHDIHMPSLRNDHENHSGAIAEDLPEIIMTPSNENEDIDVKTNKVFADVVESDSVSEKLAHGNCIDDTSEINARKDVPERESLNSLVMKTQSDNEERVSTVSRSFQTPQKSDVMHTIASEGRRYNVISTTIRPKRHSSDTKGKTRHSARKHGKSSLSERDDTLSEFIAFKNRNAPCTPPRTGLTSDLLSSFITNKDQIPSTPSSPKLSLRDEKLRSLSEGRRPFTAPSNMHINIQVEKRPPGLEKRKSNTDIDWKRPTEELFKSPDLCKSFDQEDYEIPPHSNTTRNSLFSPKTPESQRAFNAKRQESGMNRALSIHIAKDEKRFSRPVHNNQISMRSESQRLITSALGSAVILFCSLCIIARCLTFTGAKKSLLYYIVESPAVWVVRFYILVIHAIMILVEMKLRIPGILPRGTLSNFVHRAFIQSFVGLLDICMNSNKTLVEHISDGSSSTEIEKWTEISYAVLRVAPRGLIACAISYFMLAVCGVNGRSDFNRRPTFNGAPADCAV